MKTAVIGLGSNIDPVENMEEAVRRVAAAFRVEGVSSFSWTAPVGPPGQPPYLNGVVVIETDLDSEDVVRTLKVVERSMGRRISRDRYAPRTIDLDLLLWNGDIVDEDVYSRPFLVEAIREILPDWSPD